MSFFKMIFPWQQVKWRQICRLVETQQIPHAFLFSGIVGTGKTQFAENTARLLLCTNRCLSTSTTDVCHACRLVMTQCHPSVKWINPVESHAIKVDQIREGIEFVNQSAFDGEFCVLIINPADRMNLNAANALLKTLEEPPKGAIIILIANNQHFLPATIISRCQRIFFPKPSEAASLEWLQAQAIPEESAAVLLNLADGGPLRARDLFAEDFLALRTIVYQALSGLINNTTNALAVASELHTQEALPLIDLMLSWLLDVIGLQLDEGKLRNQDYQAALLSMSRRMEVKQSIQFLNRLQTFRAQYCLGMNLNKQLMLEHILLSWQGCTA